MVRLVTLCTTGAVIIIVTLFHLGVFGPRVNIETIEGAKISGKQSIEIAREMALEEEIEKESLVGSRIWAPDRITVSVIYEFTEIPPAYELPDVMNEPVYKVRFERQGHFVEIFVGADSANFYGMRLCKQIPT